MSRSDNCDSGKDNINNDDNYGNRKINYPSAMHYIVLLEPDLVHLSIIMKYKV